MPDVIITPNSGIVDFFPASTRVGRIDGSGNNFTITNPSGYIFLSSSGLAINTSSPNAELHVYSAVSGDTLFNLEGTNGSLFSVVDSLSGSLMSVNNNAGLPVFEVFSNDSIIGGRFGQNDFVISSGGNVGIGTTTPTSKLHVVGSGNITSDLTVGGNLTVNGNPVWHSGNFDASNIVRTTGTQTINGAKTFTGDFAVNPNTTFVVASTGVRFTTNNSFIIDGGNLNPGYDGDALKFDVDTDNGAGYTTTLKTSAPSSDITVHLPLNGGSLALLSNINTNQITGILPISKGGIGITGVSNGQLLIGSGTSLVANSLTAGTGISITNGSGTITINTSGLQTSLTNPVTGTGTTNTIPKWNSSSGLTNSLLSESSTTVVLGGNLRTPYGTDDTYLSIDAGSDRVGITKKTGFTSKFTYGSAASFAIAQSNNTTIAATNTFTDRFVIDSGGRVGIGTSTPSGELHVIGTGLFSERVGIGITSPPATSLHISGVVANNASILINRPGLNSRLYVGPGNSDSDPFLASVHGGDLSSSVYGWGFFDRGDGDFRLARKNLSTSWENVLSIQRSNGNVGIGTSSPTSKLHVVGSGNITSDLTVGGNLTVNGTVVTANVDRMEIEDPILTLGLASGNIVTDTNLDRGLALIRNSSTTAFMGWDSSASEFVMLSSGVASSSSGIYSSGTYGNLQINNLTANSGNFTSSIVASGFVRSGGSSSQFLKADGSVDSAAYTTNVGTVTNVSALTLNTTGNDLSSSVSNASTTPTITLSVPTASASNRGVLSSNDWTTFNNKQPSGNYVNATSGTYGNGKVLISSGNVLIPNNLTAGSGISISSTSGNIIITATGTIANFCSGVKDCVNTQLVAGNNISFVYNSGNNNLTISSTASGVGGSGISSVNADTTPRLGGNLNLNSYSVTGVGNININGTGNFISLIVGSGTAAAPSFKFINDADTGLFNAIPNALAFATSGVERMRISPSGGVSINRTSPFDIPGGTPGINIASLTVNGAIMCQSDSNSTIYSIFMSGAPRMWNSTTNDWTDGLIGSYGWYDYDNNYKELTFLHGLLVSTQGFSS